MTSASDEKQKLPGEERRYGSMKRRWIVNSLSLVAALILFAFFLAVFGSSQYYYNSLRTSLTGRANSTAQFMNIFLSRSYDEFYQNAQSVVGNYADRDKLELQIVDSMGRVVISSSGVTAGFIPSTGDVEQTLGGLGTSVWSGVNESTGERVMSVSAPLCYQNGQIIGAVRCASSMEKADAQVKMMSLMALGIGLLVFALVFISNYYFIKSIVNPVLRLNELTRQIAAGNYGIQIDNRLDDEIGELCDSINYMSEEISRAEKMKNDILSSVSHELRTPLTAIGGWSETLLASGGSDAKLMSNGLSIINKESIRLSQMVEELLDFARLEGGRMTLRIDSFDIRGELSDATFIYKDMLTRDEIVVRYDEPDEPVMVEGDRDRIRQVLLNIIDNAAKYGGAGGVIELSVYSEGDMAEVVIKDYGPGISPDDLPFIKEKFYRGGTQKARGAGIGLAVCDEIIRMHGGTLDIESRPEAGTKVIIRLPLAGGSQLA